MRLTTLERGALYWAKDIMQKEIENEEEFLSRYTYKDEDLKRIYEMTLNKKKSFLSALENLLSTKAVKGELE